VELHGLSLELTGWFQVAWSADIAVGQVVRVHPQMVAENAVDPHHFRFVHGTPISPVVLEENVDGPIWRARVGFGKGWANHPRDADGNLRTDSLNTLEIIWGGIGVSANLEHTADGMRNRDQHDSGR
jgi:3-ketosteroid 9alpha-monooxygenase subunit A